MVETTDTDEGSSDSLKEELRRYEERFPDKGYVSVSLALTGQNPFDDDSNHTVDEPLSELDRFTAVDRLMEATPEEGPEIDRLRSLLQGLMDRTVETFEMRQYSTDPGAEETEAQASENKNPYTLATFNCRVIATARVAVYDLGDTYAIILNRERHYGMFPVRWGGRYHGNFEVHFTDDPDSHMESEFYKNDWRRREHFDNTAAAKDAANV